MKASYITKYGGADEIRFGELPEPVLTKNTVLVRVKAVSLNPIDIIIRKGIIKMLTGSKFPKVLGFDFAGIIRETGESIHTFHAGDRIYGTIPPFFGKPGALAEFVCASPKRIRKIPDGMTFEEAAAIPVASLTAWSGLRKSGDLHGKTLLVNGATGGVGHFAVQIGKAKGARVTATCSTKNMDLAHQLGADEVIDYTQNDLARLEKKFDIILDAFGKMKPGTARRLLHTKGIFTSTHFYPPAMFSSMVIRLVEDKRLTSANMRAKQEDFMEIENLFRKNELKPFIGGIFTPEDTSLAYETIEQGRARGKTIVRWD